MRTRARLLTLAVNDRVEDRSLFSGTGVVAFITGNEVRVRFDDGSEEAVDEELFTPYDLRPGNRTWLI